MHVRNREIDALRGIAVLLMILFHLLFDLKYFYNFDFTFRSGPLFFLRVGIASLFLFLVGISLTLSKRNLQKNIIRGIKILLLGFVITLITYALFPKEYIFFGILHCIGASIILSYPLIRRPKLALALSATALALGNIIKYDFPPFFSSAQNSLALDYYPLFPWIGIIFFGIFLGNILQNSLRKEHIFLSKSTVKRGFAIIGQHALLLYFTHQIVIFGFLFLLNYFFVFSL